MSPGKAGRGFGYDIDMRFLVTAGNTREKIDQVRDWGNIFTGNTGYAIAQALARQGEVDLLTSNRQHLAEVQAGRFPGISATAFLTHADLLGAIESQLHRRSYDAVFMTAAVSDYRPAGAYAVVERNVLVDGTEQWTVRNVQAGKIRSNHEFLAVLGEPTEKIIDLFRTRWGHQGLLVKFKLEVGIDRQQLIEVGQASRKASAADYLVANTLDMVEGENAGAYLLSDAGAEWVARADLPGRMVELTEK
jgi:phosphopantothenoylcysteine synthetase/decarboxylase